ncbi:MAG: hypothetical protein KFF73_04440 [Cyclobacteriaceae bacterium]|nr:hypothetical protein [Cyclobacteriaceae bacterium]
MIKILIPVATWFLLVACSTTENSEPMGNTFQEDIDFLKQRSDAIILKNEDGSSQIVVVPEYQGRVMTSTLNGESGMGFGWINYEKIREGTMDERFNAYGGEDRFWLGPEGGQFSLFHKKGGKFTLDNWFVPKQLDADKFTVTDKSQDHVSMESDFNIFNYSGTEFRVGVKRSIRLLAMKEISRILKVGQMDDYQAVGFESENHLINQGDSAWTKETGLLSIWILGMYNPGNEVVIVIPYYQGGTGSLGEIVNDSYFGEVPPDRLKIDAGVVYFMGDGKYRSKIGLNWMRAKDFLGSYDPERNVLTVVRYNKPEEKSEYVKSMWEIMDDPYEGDVVNSYNDGPPEPGAKPMGPFYELETSSPVKPLKPGEEIVHIHQTFHIRGSEEQLNSLTEQLFEVKIQQIKDAFSR